MSTYNLARPYLRTSPRPIDSTLVFSTFADLSSYASTGPTAYRGQIVAVSGTNTPYIISDQLSALPIALQSYVGSYVGSGFLPLSGGFVTGNIISNSAISANEIDVDNIQIVGNTISITNANGDLTLSPNGNGEVNISKVDINSGTIDGVTIGTAVAATSISAALLNVDNIRIDGNTISSTNTDGNIVLAPNNNGDVQLDADTIRVGDSGGVATVTTNGAGNLVLNTNGGSNSGFITINQGVNGNIELTPNGTGNVVIPKADINGGTIDNTSIGFTTPASGVFTGINVLNDVSIGGNLYVSGSATTLDTVNLVVSDPIIFLAEGNLVDTVDIGFTAAYNHGLTPKRHTGLIRNNANGKYVLFTNLSAEILSAVNIPFTDPSLRIATLSANIEGTLTGNVSGTLTGNVSGTAAQAVKLTTARTISAGGDISYVSGAFDGTANVVGTATINNNAVTYAKFQEVTSSSVVGNPTGSQANARAIPASVTGFALLSATNAAAAATTLGLGSAQSVTFGDVTVNNSSNKSVLSKVYSGSTSNNTLTLTTFPSATYFSAKYTAQIKQPDNNKRCALEIIATNNDGTWEGTVYGIVDPGSIFSNVNIGLQSNSVYLEFTFIGAVPHEVIVYAEAFSD